VLLKVPVGDGSDAFVEVEVDYEDLGQSVRLVADDPVASAVASFTLTSSINKVLPAIRTVLGGLRNVDLAPDEIGMEMGLKVGGETGLVFAKGKTEAAFVLKMTWRRPPATAAAEEERRDPPESEDDETAQPGGT